MRSVARAPAFIQLESEDILTGVERVGGFGCNGVVLYRGYGRARHGFQSPARSTGAVVPFVACSESDKSGTV